MSRSSVSSVLEASRLPWQKLWACLCLPYCYCRAVNGGGAYGIAFALLLLFAFLTKATTVYVTVAIVLLGILLLHSRKAKSKVVIVAMSLICAASCFAVLVVPFTGGQLISANTIDTLEAVLGKISDVGNQSTAYRTSTLINDIEIFKDYPIFGVGDGNQGFFYAQNLPSWILASGSTEALSALSGSIGVLNGGAFLPSIISGYGIVGCVLFGVWIGFCIRMAIRRKKEPRALLRHVHSCHFRLYSYSFDGRRVPRRSRRCFSHFLHAGIGRPEMSMTISFFSNFFNAHQLPVARELAVNPGVDYAFVAMRQVDGLEGRAAQTTNIRSSSSSILEIRKPKKQ